LCRASQKRDPAEVQDVLRTALHDPTLELGYLGPIGYVDVHGRTLLLPEEGGDRMTTRIGDEVLVHDAALADQPELEAVVDATHIALERGLSLRSLEASERRATALLDAIPDSMYRVSRDGTFLEFASARLPACRPRRSVGRDDDRGRHRPEAVVEVSAAMARALDHGTTELVEYTLDQPELREVEPVRHIEARIVRSGPDEVVAIVRDITERKRQQEALEALAAEQAALSRVAVAVATASRPDVLFNVVTQEVALQLGADAANLIRFERNEPEGVVGRHLEQCPGGDRPDRTRFPAERRARHTCPETGQPARGHIDDPEIVPSPIVDTLRDQGVRWMVSAPIAVSGELWGAVVVTTTGDRTSPATPRADRPVRRARRNRARERGSTRAALRPRRRAGRRQPRGARDRNAEHAETTFYIVTEELGRLLAADAAILGALRARQHRGGDRRKVERTGRRGRRSGADDPLGRRTAHAGSSHREAITRRDRRRLRSVPRVRRRLSELGASSMIAAPIKGQASSGDRSRLRHDEKELTQGAEDRIEKFAALVSARSRMQTRWRRSRRSPTSRRL
jgi:hypothetical protein